MGDASASGFRAALWTSPDSASTWHRKRPLVLNSRARHVRRTDRRYPLHLWDLANGYAWLSSPVPEFERLIGNYDELRRNFLAPDYIPLTRDSNVVKSVHVQAFGFPGYPVAETQWLQKQADSTVTHTASSPTLT
jgi:hypothetical protein